MAGKPTIQDIFMHHFDEVRNGGKLSKPQQRAGHAIVACRTEAMGGHEQRCPDGHHVRTQYHSCRHRSCPTCAEKAKGEWLDRQQDRLLPCDHLHVIFTVPHELLALWRYDRREFTDALFGACRDTLLQLLGQERPTRRHPGILMALHRLGTDPEPASAHPLSGERRRDDRAG
ncbi:MAG: transposase zinc-binding domain-containing protein [Halofilum sp. (in: g-proteobacteria)]|nr:transposase zinc-binding domain-containing protein [Halofilum sp. (in: g-proteobacteria)]